MEDDVWCERVSFVWIVCYEMDLRYVLMYHESTPLFALDEVIDILSFHHLVNAQQIRSQ